MKEKGFFIVSADLPLNAERYMLERDSKAFRDLLSRVSSGDGRPQWQQIPQGSATDPYYRPLRPLKSAPWSLWRPGPHLRAHRWCGWSPAPILGPGCPKHCRARLASRSWSFTMCEVGHAAGRMTLWLGDADGWASALPCLALLSGVPPPTPPHPPRFPPRSLSTLPRTSPGPPTRCP